MLGTFSKWLTGMVVLAFVALIVELFAPWGVKARSEATGNSIELALDNAGFKSVNIEGHTDADGSAEYNLDLS